MSPGEDPWPWWGPMGPGGAPWALEGTHGAIATKMRDAMSGTNLRPSVQNFSQICSAVSEAMRPEWTVRQSNSKPKTSPIIMEILIETVARFLCVI